MHTSKATAGLSKSLSSTQKITVNERPPVRPATPAPAPVAAPSVERSASAAEAVASSTKSLREQIDTTGAQIGHGGSGGTLGFICKAMSTEIRHVSVDRVEVNRVAGDPITVELQVDPSAAFVAIVNAERFTRDGKPLLLGVLVRDGVDPKGLDLSGFARAGGDPFRKMAVGQTQVTFRSADEKSFAFGTPIVQISYDAAGCEAQRSARTRPSNNLTQHILRGNDHREIRSVGDALDRTPVQALLDNLRLQIEGAPPAWWPGDAFAEPSLRVVADQGLIRQPGSDFSVQAKKVEQNLFSWDTAVRWTNVGGPIAGSVAATDASFAGNAPAKGEALRIADFGDDVLGLSFAVTTQSNSRRGDERFDRTTNTTSARQLLRDQWALVKIGGAQPSSETVNDPREIAVRRELSCTSVDLPAGWVSGAKAGWTIDVGYTGLDGMYRSLERRTIDNTGKSPALGFRFDAERLPANTSLEIRVHDDRGLPAHRARLSP